MGRTPEVRVEAASYHALRARADVLELMLRANLRVEDVAKVVGFSPDVMQRDVPIGKMIAHGPAAGGPLPAWRALYYRLVVYEIIEREIAKPELLVELPGTYGSVALAEKRARRTNLTTPLRKAVDEAKTLPAPPGVQQRWLGLLGHRRRVLASILGRERRGSAVKIEAREWTRKALADILRRIRARAARTFMRYTRPWRDQAREDIRRATDPRTPWEESVVLREAYGLIGPGDSPTLERMREQQEARLVHLLGAFSRTRRTIENLCNKRGADRAPLSPGERLVLAELYSKPMGAPFRTLTVRRPLRTLRAR